MLTFYGLELAREEGWRVKCYPGRAHRDESPEDLQHFRLQGAVVVDMKGDYTEHHSGREGSRQWWFGLPPMGADVDLRELARHAGMTGEQPETFKWRPPE